MKAKIEYIDKLVACRYDECAEEVIRHIKALGPECRQSGDDSLLEDVWEEFKSQLQEGKSVLFDAYEQTIQQICALVVGKMSPTEFRLLWFWSDGYVEWDESEEGEPPYMEEDVVKELYWYVCNIATNEDLAYIAEDEEDEDSENEDEVEGNEEESEAAEDNNLVFTGELPLFDQEPAGTPPE